MSNSNNSFLVNHVNNKCNKQSCWICRQGDKYDNIEDCPLFKYKQIARERKVTAEDISNEEEILRRLKDE